MSQYEKKLQSLWHVAINSLTCHRTVTLCVEPVKEFGMIDRRKLMISGLAVGALGLAAPAIAHQKGEAYVLPEEHLPREIKLKTKLSPLS